MTRKTPAAGRSRISRTAGPISAMASSRSGRGRAARGPVGAPPAAAPPPGRFSTRPERQRRCGFPRRRTMLAKHVRPAFRWHGGRPAVCKGFPCVLPISRLSLRNGRKPRGRLRRQTVLPSPALGGHLFGASLDHRPARAGSSVCGPNVGLQLGQLRPGLGQFVGQGCGAAAEPLDLS